MTAADADLLARLRRCTGPLHDRIEALLRLQSPMTVSRYGRVLRGFHEFLRLWEQRIAFALPGELKPWYAERQRSGFLTQDLAALNVPADAALRRAARAAQALIRLDSPAAALGSLYVIEGSALGGQVLTRELSRQHGWTPEAGLRYFHGFGERTGALWRDFREVAQAHAGASEDDRDAACVAAVQTFEALIATFDVLDALDDADAAHAIDAVDPADGRRAADEVDEVDEVDAPAAHTPAVALH